MFEVLVSRAPTKRRPHVKRGGVKPDHPPFVMTKTEVLLVQYTKLLNYLAHDLHPDWGGEHCTTDEQREHCRRTFLDDTLADDPTMPYRWLHKRDLDRPWGPGNLRFRDYPCLDFGRPYEVYLCCNGAVLSALQASRLLAIDKVELVKLKLRLLYDRKVIQETVKRLLQPRTDWDKVY